MLPDIPGDIVIRELARGKYRVKTVALFTALEGHDPRVISLQQEVCPLIDFHYVSKIPQCLESFLRNPSLNSIENIRSIEMEQFASHRFDDRFAQVTL